MDITSVTPSNQVFGGTSFSDEATQAEVESKSSAGMISSDFETFLKMLTAQLENQDPLNPIESTDYAVQLATFSGVEQQVQTNDLLAELKDQIAALGGTSSAGGMANLGSWVGLEVRAPSSVYFDQSPVTIAPQPKDGAYLSAFVVRDSSGAEVERSYDAVTGAPVEWDGVDAYGNPYSSGLYSFHMVHYTESGESTEEQVEVYTEIVEARLEGDTTILVLENGDEITSDQVSILSTGG
ncbi:MAG: flagellar hook capping FlgD N-terminal domain-containing protein [Maritimibacter sp.]